MWKKNYKYKKYKSIFISIYISIILCTSRSRGYHKCKPYSPMVLNVQSRKARSDDCLLFPAFIHQNMGFILFFVQSFSSKMSWSWALILLIDLPPENYHFNGGISHVNSSFLSIWHNWYYHSTIFWFDLLR